MLETMPSNLELVQIQASMLSASTIDVRDEIATLLAKMAKNIATEEKEESANHKKVQSRCHRSRIGYKKAVKAAKKKQAKEQRKQDFHHNEQSAIPGKVLRLEAKIKNIKYEISLQEQVIKKQQKQRDVARGVYLQNIADFNKALEDIDTLRLLVEKGLSNRGQGSKGDARFTQSPTKKGAKVAPTPAGYDRKVTHKKANAGKFLEIESAEQIASMSAEESVNAMKGVYSNLRTTVSDNTMVISLLDTLDSAMDALSHKSGSAVDKIRSLLLQVRNELQKSKQDLTEQENKAVSAWQTQKTVLRNGINDKKIVWNQVYKEKAQLWRDYGDHFRQEGKAMRAKAQAKAREDRNQINMDFEYVVCKSQDADFKANSAKRHGQLEQIKKALDLLSKMSLSGKYGAMVRDTIKDVTVGLCRKFDDHSAWVSVAGSDLSNYVNNRPNKSSKIAKFAKDWKPKFYADNKKATKDAICVSKIQYTVTCRGPCRWASAPSKFNIAINFKKENKDEKQVFGSPAKFTKELAKASWWYGSQDKAAWRGTKKGAATRNDVSLFVVPDCNCGKIDKDYHVDGSILKND